MATPYRIRNEKSPKHPTTALGTTQLDAPARFSLKCRRWSRFSRARNAQNDWRRRLGVVIRRGFSREALRDSPGANRGPGRPARRRAGRCCRDYSVRVRARWRTRGRPRRARCTRRRAGALAPGTRRKRFATLAPEFRDAVIVRVPGPGAAVVTAAHLFERGGEGGERRRQPRFARPRAAPPSRA